MVYSKLVMSNEYIIQWKSKVNGRAGRGSKVFGKEEAELLAEELNLEYPDIVHEAIPTPPPSGTPIPETTTPRVRTESEENEEEMVFAGR